MSRALFLRMKVRVAEFCGAKNSCFGGVGLERRLETRAPAETLATAGASTMEGSGRRALGVVPSYEP